MTKRAKPINLALQGGGAHGAFTWGVLDRLIEDGRVSFDAISATSAGAMNAVACIYGAAIGGPDEARRLLHDFWKTSAEFGGTQGPVVAEVWNRLTAPFGALDQGPAYHMFDSLVRTFSPYQLNPLNINPLRDILERLIDFDELHRRGCGTRLYLSATNVRTGKIKVFENSEIGVEHVLASACLPYIFHAVEIDGEHYWDGGYMGNPAIFPLIYGATSRDVLIVHINPLERLDVPRTAPEIFNRINEISFNSSLMREMRAIAFVTRLIDDGALSSDRYSRMLIHAIHGDEFMRDLSIATKLSPSWSFLCELRDLGRRIAEEWLEANFDAIGERSSVDIEEMYL
ncbi:MAG: patatin-like phospholipase family protein [Rhizobiales bacterium]|nr:patatin-like phospholipase family protein [Hyphomicrobiales bacterium]